MKLAIAYSTQTSPTLPVICTFLSWLHLTSFYSRLPTGLKIFLNQHLDAVILEVGIGGRLDATNVIPEPVVTGVTSLGFDHMELLGHTLAKIAGEKAGIFKAGSPALTVTQPVEAMEVLEVRWL